MTSDIHSTLLQRIAGAADAAGEAQSTASKTAYDLEWPTLLEELAELCRTEMGAERARRLVALERAELVEHRLREVEEARELVQTDRAPALAGLVDVGEALARAERDGVLEGVTLRTIATCARISDEARRDLRSAQPEAPRLAELAHGLHSVGWLAAIIEEAVENDGTLKDDASPDLGALRVRARTTDQRLKQRVERALLHPDLEPYLQDRFFTIRDGRYVFPIKISDHVNVPGIVHGRSGSGQTLFIEPTELVDANNQLKVAQIAVEEEELRILAELGREVAQVATDLRENLVRLAYLDVTLAAGRLAELTSATRPELAERARIDLRRARHPLLALREARSEGAFRVVPNDIRFGKTDPGLSAPGDDETGPVLVISGPNTGGKTVSLKTLGLVAMMVRRGMLIPVDEGSRVPLFEAVFADIGDDQSLSENLSSFSAHLTNIKRYFPRVNAHSLVLLDEIFSGTDPTEGGALAASLLEVLAERGALIAVTTHSQPLKRYALGTAGFVNASMGFDLARLEPTYELHLGLPGASHAVGIARRLGLPESILTRAEALLEGESLPELERLLAEVEAHRQRLEMQTRDLQLARAAAEDQARHHARERKRLEQAALEDVNARLQALFDQIRDAEQTLRAHRAELSQPVAAAGLTAARVEAIAGSVRRLKKDLEATREARERDVVRQERASLDPNDLELGRQVWVRSLKRTGTVTEVDRSRGQAWVQVGRLKSTVAFDDLFDLTDDELQEQAVDVARAGVAERRERRQGAQSEPTPGEDAPDPPQHPGNTTDLRGLRVDEALAQLERGLDDAVRRQETVLYVIHGHGTGALKKAVRDYLGDSVYARTFHPAERRRGGDGVTVVVLA